MEARFYAGIGSRQTPPDAQVEMSRLAGMLEELGFTLRSGNAKGADQAFASGVEKNAQIWLPWGSFEFKFALTKPDHAYRNIAYDTEAFKSVLAFHPRPSSLTRVASLLMARNYRQIVGHNEADSEFVICWTPGGAIKGGTGQALRIANHRHIPIINMFTHDGHHAMTAESVIAQLSELEIL
jgi:hypothetical protein